MKKEDVVEDVIEKYNNGTIIIDDDGIYGEYIMYAFNEMWNYDKFSILKKIINENLYKEEIDLSTIDLSTIDLSKYEDYCINQTWLDTFDRNSQDIINEIRVSVGYVFFQIFKEVIDILNIK